MSNVEWAIDQAIRDLHNARGILAGIDADLANMITDMDNAKRGGQLEDLLNSVSNAANVLEQDRRAAEDFARLASDTSMELQRLVR